MEKQYWIGRKRAAMAMARRASTAEARLIHYDLAGRYSIKAAQCVPFMLSSRAPATGGERAMLHLPDPRLARPAPFPGRRQQPGARRDPGAPAGEIR